MQLHQCVPASGAQAGFLLEFALCRLQRVDMQRAAAHWYFPGITVRYISVLANQPGIAVFVNRDNANGDIFEQDFSVVR